MAIPTYNPQEIEPKWQQYWLDNKTFATPEAPTRDKRYVLDMFPYPSGDGLHVGHTKIYTGSDIVARYLRLKGFAVLHPTGWDAFGLPTENSAIKFGVHPAKLTEQNINRFRQQMQQVGLSYDWGREVNTTDPTYYKWTQWIFLQLYKMGLAYEDTIPINWCPKDKTGLANEEVIDGKCERCGTPVEQKPMRQWLLRITRYADELQDDLDGLDWPKFIIELQRNWIGRSRGAEITFTLQRHEAATLEEEIAQGIPSLTVFTTRPDTICGATYLVLAPEHPLINQLVTPEQRTAVAEYQRAAQAKTDMERANDARDKTGVFTGAYAMNPITNEAVPIWIADYVVMSYGTGAIMAVPAHDERDFAFATNYQLPIKQVITPPADTPAALPYLGEGKLIESGSYTGLDSAPARARITKDLQNNQRGQGTTQYKIRDWVFSRQRYWGEPIPIIHCDKCGTVPVPEDDLPVELPPVEKYQPTGTGESPLAAMTDWLTVKCPTCPNLGRRETNTMPQWAGSSWYFVRFTDPRNDQALSSREATLRWLPVDVYVGGAEHAVLHLLYARFWTKALRDAGVLPLDEPFIRLRSVGLVMGEDGQKMSKSRGNVVTPDDIIAQYGADTLRVYEMFMGPFDGSVAWDTSSIAGAHRFLTRIWNLVHRHAAAAAANPAPDASLALHLQQTLQRVSEGIEQFKFNTAIAALMELLNRVETLDKLSVDVLKTMLIMLNPFAPHITEELWQAIGQTGSISGVTWPVVNLRLLRQAAVTLAVQVNGRVRGTLTLPPGGVEAVVVEQAQSLPNVAKHVAGKTVVKTIFVPDRLVNFVTN